MESFYDHIPYSPEGSPITVSPPSPLSPSYFLFNHNDCEFLYNSPFIDEEERIRLSTIQEEKIRLKLESKRLAEERKKSKDKCLHELDMMDRNTDMLIYCKDVLGYEYDYKINAYKK